MGTDKHNVLHIPLPILGLFLAPKERIHKMKENAKDVRLPPSVFFLSFTLHRTPLTFNIPSP